MACSGCYYTGSKDGQEAICSGKCKMQRKIQHGKSSKQCRISRKAVIKRRKNNLY